MTTTKRSKQPHPSPLQTYEMDYDFTDHASTAKPMHGASTPLNSVPDFFLGSESINRTAIEGEVLPPTIVDDEDIYSEEEEGEISTDDGDSRAGDWEPNMEYGDTLVMDNDHYKESWEVFTAHETATSVQYKPFDFSTVATGVNVI